MAATTSKEGLLEEGGATGEVPEEGGKAIRPGDSGAEASEGDEVGAEILELGVVPDEGVGVDVDEVHLLEEGGVHVEVAHQLGQAGLTRARRPSSRRVVALFSKVN